MEVILHLEGDVDELRDGGIVRRQPRQLLVGEVRRPSLVRPLGPCAIIGARLTPAGVRAFFDAPAHGLIDQTFALDTVLDLETRSAVAGVVAAEPSDRLRLFETALLGKVRRCRRHDALVARVVGELECPGALPSLDDIARRSGITRRQLERRFLDAVGIPPRTVAQLARFQRALALLQSRRVCVRIADAAAACGYYDQAHLVRDFKRFAGLPPQAFFRREEPFADLFRSEPALDVAFVQSASGGLR
jgi:transcriptional regulator GlxA family with amidase domain